MLVSNPSGICEAMERMGAFAVLHVSPLDMPLGYIASCRSCDVDWPWCTSSWFPSYVNIGELFDVLLCIASTKRRVNANERPIGNCIAPLLKCFCTRASYFVKDCSGELT